MVTPSPAKLFLGLALLQAAHSAEECLTRLWTWFPVVTGSIHRLISPFPIIVISSRTFIGLNVLVVASMLVIAAFMFRGKHWAMRLAFIIGVGEVFNGLVHVTGAIVRGGYFPGAVSGAGLIVVALLLIYAYQAGCKIETRQTGG